MILQSRVSPSRVQSKTGFMVMVDCVALNMSRSSRSVKEFFLTRLRRLGDRQRDLTLVDCFLLLLWLVRRIQILDSDFAARSSHSFYTAELFASHQERQRQSEFVLIKIECSGLDQFPGVR
jgi:hypothetical protein